MEPATIGAALGVLSRFFKLGLAIEKVGEKWGMTADEAAALESLFSASRDFVGLFGGGTAAPTRLVALHTVVVTRAFGAACREHWAGNVKMAPSFEKKSWLRRLVLSDDEEQRSKDIDSRLTRALERFAKLDERKPAKAFQTLTAMLDDPIASPSYGALWEAFTNPLLYDGEQARPIELEDPGAKLEFERLFRLAYAEAVSSSADLSRNLYELEAERPRLLRELVVRWVSTWKGRHVFGNADTRSVPMMPLGDIYVEPDGMYELKRAEKAEATRKPIRQLIRELMKDHKVVIVRGDFGQGKSLTARTLACEWAETYLTDKCTRSPDVPYPLFVKCSEDFPNHEPTLKRIVPGALQRQLREVGIDLTREDEALVVPPGNLNLIYLIDGLDEVALSQGEVESFFKELSTSIGGTGRAVVFSRKGVIPSTDKLRGIPIVDVEHLRTDGDRDGGQIADWLERWNRLSGRPAIQIEDIRERDLLEIAKTPILLFMVAMTWEDMKAREGNITRAQIYEKFFLQVAAGKCQQDQDTHGQVAQASQKLLNRLIEDGELEKAPTDTPQSHGLARAMLWMLARIAWESQRCAAKDEDLTLHEVTTILKGELGLGGEATTLEMVKVGILLALQADQQGGNHQILFGHKSFREFLVARYWADRLKQILQARLRDRRSLEKRLLGARLLQEDDESFDFLMQIVNGDGWTTAERSKLVEWAEECFNDEAPKFADNDHHSWLEDLGPVLREAALAIGSSVHRSLGIKLERPKTLRSMLAWFWMREESPIVVAPGLHGAGAELAQGELGSANFRGAVLCNSDLQSARLYHADLSNSDLTGCNLMEANLYRASLSGATLKRIFAENALCHHADLRGVNLEGAQLVEVSFYGADLRGANLRGAMMLNSTLKNANLRGADLRQAVLRDASLASADLRGADLTEADLRHADLKRATLIGINDTEITDEEGPNALAIFTGARFDSETEWPEGFDPIAAGAVEVQKEGNRPADEPEPSHET